MVKHDFKEMIELIKYWFCDNDEINKFHMY